MSDKKNLQTDITIIGGGASGTLLLIHLLRELKKNSSITLVNSRYPIAQGIAYSTNDEEHLLNVRAARMSVFPDKPDDFVEWIRTNKSFEKFHSENLPERFVPRSAYGQYLEQTLQHYLKKYASAHQIKLLEDEVTDLEFSSAGFIVNTESGDSFTTSKAILATGNTPPSHLPGLSSLPHDDRIRVNPWAIDAHSELNSDEDVFIMGSGLTMADTLLSLKKVGFRGRMLVLSRHAKIPLTHPPERLHSQSVHVEPIADLHSLYHQIKNRIKEVIQNDFWEEPVLEAIRPHTQSVWQKFSIEQKERFLRHLNHRWSILRHRIPSEVRDEIHVLERSGQLILEAGDLIAVDTSSDKLLTVQYKRRKDGVTREVQVQRIFNCTGPEGNLEKVQRLLIQNLLKRGMIRPDPLKLGFDAFPDGNLIGRNGQQIPNFYTLGPGLRGILWESTAIPEIRLQAQLLARKF